MRSLWWKLTIAFLIVSLTGAVVAAIFVGNATQQAFQNNVFARDEANFVTQMANYYQLHGSWEGVGEFYHSQARPDQHGFGQTGPDQFGPPFVLVDQHCVALIPGHSYQPGQTLAPAQCNHGQAVTVNGATVGRVLIDGAPPPLSPQDTAFLDSTERALIFGALAAALIALGLGVVLARSLTRPVRELTTAIHAMAGGELRQAVPVRSRDELGELSAAFNTMSADLAYANQQRRQMTADIAHDLRTPVTVIAGYLEALRDGVLPPSPDRFAILYAEAQHLHGLIEDLRTLSLADAGELALHPQPIAPRALLERIVGAYLHQAEQQGVTLTVVAPEDAPEVAVDVTRMTQVLNNLVSNALRYTPPGGTITLGATATAQVAELRVSDTGQGIMPDALPRIFDRFYRADSSRAQSEGESGLGLAIVKALVEAHGGQISVTSQPGGGATFAIVLPGSLTKVAYG
jgi:signal transduction histidine kinase